MAVVPVYVCGWMLGILLQAMPMVATCGTSLIYALVKINK